MVGHGGSSAGSYLADPTSPTPSHCASIVTTSTLRVNFKLGGWVGHIKIQVGIDCGINRTIKFQTAAVLQFLFFSY